MRIAEGQPVPNIPAHTHADVAETHVAFEGLSGEGEGTVSGCLHHVLFEDEPDCGVCFDDLKRRVQFLLVGIR